MRNLGAGGSGPPESLSPFTVALSPNWGDGEKCERARWASPHESGMPHLPVRVTHAALIRVLFLVAAGGGKMELKSRAFEPGAMIPAKYTCDGENVSPPLDWSDPPAGTQSFALVSDDPDAPVGTWVHWVIWNIPAGARALEENLPKRESLSNGANQGTNDFRRIGYRGPCPPSGTHRYFFKLYALDTALSLPPHTTKSVLDKAMRGHILGQAGLMGSYRRR